jgi:lipopolysaccharide transport system ATP-binding protein
MSAILALRGIGKRYALNRQRPRTLRETIVDGFRAPLRLFQRRPTEDRTFWALKDVSFDVAPGEALGIIGRNGAGKSTLLKVVSRITAPTTGEVRLRGKVASLLEIGTGFHSELTGRENIFLNGAIMGMSRADVRARFDEIIAFADVDPFIDTPVKHYSSGMYVRLAFAVAAHLRPDILLVDEVLAVGDAAFQKKCLGKMQRVASGGRTVLFVSHNVAAIARLCTRAILLSHGGVVADGPVASVVATYLGGTLGDAPHEVDFERSGRAPAGNAEVRLLAARVVSDDTSSATMDIGRPLRVEIDFELLREREAYPSLSLINDQSICVFVTGPPAAERPRTPGRYRSTVEIPGNLLAAGTFSLDVALVSERPQTIFHVYERGLLSFHVADADDGSTVLGGGVVRPALSWTLAPQKSVAA